MESYTTGETLAKATIHRATQRLRFKQKNCRIGLPFPYVTASPTELQYDEWITVERATRQTPPPEKVYSRKPKFKKRKKSKL